MCTIITVDSTFYNANRADIRDQIKTDAIYNGDGWSLVCIDADDPSLNIQVNSLNVRTILKAIDDFFDGSSLDSRIFLHARAATTGFVGIGYCHGFTDSLGRIIMHNGIISNPDGLAVDSYRLTHLPYSSDDMLDYFRQHGDNYVNMFVIDTNTDSYVVVRLAVGSLFHDGQGNYSTNRIGSIRLPVSHHTVKHHAYMTAADEFDAPFFKAWE